MEDWKDKKTWEELLRLFAGDGYGIQLADGSPVMGIQHVVQRIASIHAPGIVVK